MRIERERLIEGSLCLLVIAGLTEPFHHAIGVRAPETAMRERERWIERHGAFEMFDRVVHIFARDRVINIAP